MNKAGFICRLEDGWQGPWIGGGGNKVGGMGGGMFGGKCGKRKGG